jgi:hypothetical protein
MEQPPASSYVPEKIGRFFMTNRGGDIAVRRDRENRPKLSLMAGAFSVISGRANNRCRMPKACGG